jgi:PAS domain-containing protein
MTPGDRKINFGNTSERKFAVQNLKLFSSAKIRYGLIGIGFGLVFPLIGTLIEAYVTGRGVNFANLLFVQQGTPLLWIIDTAPFFFGLAFGLAGARQDRLQELLDRQEHRVQERTTELSLANAQLERDVEVLHQVESVIEHGKKEWEAIFDSVSDMIFVADAQGMVVRCNRAVVEKLNLSFPKIIGKSLAELVFAGGAGGSGNSAARRLFRHFFQAHPFFGRYQPGDSCLPRCNRAKTNRKHPGGGTESLANLN